MAFNDTIRWPEKLDVDFPNLRNNDSAAISENEKLYAAHFNKVRNLVLKAYDLMQNTVSASGDGSLQKISIPVVFDIPFQALVKVGAFDASSNPQLAVPGNVLPFEFILTNSSDDYSKLVGRGGSVLLNKKTASALLSQFGGLSIVAPKLHATAILTGPSDKIFDRTKPFPNTFAVSINANIGGDTILIRGVVIDSKLDSIQASNGLGPQFWLLPNNQQTNLRIALCAMSPQ